MPIIKRLATWNCVLIILVFLWSCEDKPKILTTVQVKVTSSEDIIPLEDSLVTPVLYQNIPSLKPKNLIEAKKNFIALLLPGVLIAKHEFNLKEKRIRKIYGKDVWSTDDSVFYKEQAALFKAKNINDLLVRMQTHPNSLVLAQAAVESGWGSSRFFKDANNVFGIWSYDRNEPRMPASKADIFVRKYTDISQSIEDYFITIGRANAYRSFRVARFENDDVFNLIPHLKHYSQLGSEYTNLLQKIVRQNNLTMYDHYMINPTYFVEQ